MAEQTHKQALPMGYRLQNFRVIGVLGVGGFGVTYLAEHATLGYKMAIKEYLPKEFALRDGATVHPKSEADRDDFEWGLTRFFDEARTLVRFEHRNLVRVRDYFEANHSAYIVMDYEDGEPLDRLLEDHGALSEAQLRCILLPIVEGLREVHATGFLHRDIKPSNIFVRRADESPVLLDFGAARQALGRKSQSMMAVVSAGYSPPEQYESEGEQGPWSDIYALAALCYRAITGTAPVEAPLRLNRLAQRQPDPLPRLSDTAKEGYSITFLEAVVRGLEVVVAERPVNLEEWVARFCNASALAVRMFFPIDQKPGVDVSLTNPGPAPLGEPPPGAQDLYCKAAEQGDADAQFDLGVIYDIGEDVSRDVAQAVIWYRKAAGQGHPAAQNNLGYMYQHGEGVPEDDVQAVNWYRKAAEQGNAFALLNLGFMYRNGKGVPRDDAQAVSWYRKAAEQGEAKAQFKLGYMYQYGVCVPKDDAQAVSWYRKAARQGEAGAQNNLGFMYENGTGVPRDKVQAVNWYRKAAEQGDAKAQNNLACSGAGRY